MKICNKQTAPPSADMIAEITRSVLSEFPDNPRRLGSSYYNRAFGERIYKILRKLMKSPTKSGEINTTHARISLSTAKAQLAQGSAWLRDGGLNKIFVAETPDAVQDLANVQSALDSLVVAGRKTVISLRIIVSDKDMDDMFVATEAPPDEESFDEGLFREQLIEFMNTATDDSQIEWRNAPDSANSFALSIARQDKYILIDYDGEKLVAMKVSASTLDGLNVE